MATPLDILLPPLIAQGSSASESVLFYGFGLVAVVSALGVVISRNIVRTAVCLLFTLAAVAGLYFLLNAEFLAAVQLVIYVGGTLILMLFGVMLTSKSPFSKFEPARWEVALGCGVAGVVFVTLVRSLLIATRPASFAHAPLPDDSARSLLSIGVALMGDDLAPFELASVLLLLVMIGAAYLAKRRRTNLASK